MGVKDYLLTSTLNGTLSQRLVRTLCRHYTEAYTSLPKLVEELDLKTLCNGNELLMYKAVG